MTTIRNDKLGVSSREDIMDRRTLLRIGAGSALGVVATRAPAFAQQKAVLKAADVHPLGYPTVEAVVRMGKKLEAATAGRLSIQMYPSMQLGGEKEMIEQAQVGALQIARISVGPMGPLVPELNVFNLPFMFRDAAHMEKVIDGGIGDEMLKKLSEHGIAHHADLETLEVLHRLDGVLAVVDVARPAIHPAQADQARGAVIGELLQQLVADRAVDHLFHVG